MTCIVGWVDSETKRTHLGGDAAGVAGLHLVRRRDPKVFVNGPYVMGFTDSFRMGQLLHHAFVPPVPQDDQDLDAFMVTTFIDALRTCLKDGGYARKKEEEERGGTFLVGYQHHLFEIEADYQVARSCYPFAAVGCGRDLALGALHATLAENLTPRDRLERALQAADAFSGGVSRPFTFVATPAERLE